MTAGQTKYLDGRTPVRIIGVHWSGSLLVKELGPRGRKVSAPADRVRDRLDAQLVANAPEPAVRGGVDPNFEPQDNGPLFRRDE